MNKAKFYLSQIIDTISMGYSYVIHRNKNKIIKSAILQNNPVSKNKAFVKNKKRK